MKDRKHAKLSASGSTRWINCPGSVKAEEGIKEIPSPFAFEGEMAHLLAEKALIGGRKTDSFIGERIQNEDGFSIVVTSEMAQYVGEYVDRVLNTAGNGELFVEVKVDFSRWVPEGFGTSDVVIIADDKLIIIDLKFGQGVKVDAHDNSQLKLYALGAYEEFKAFYDIGRVEMIIDQPRLNHVSDYEMTIEDLLNWGNVVSDAAKRALSPKAERVPGESQCRWCKAKALCRPLKEHLEASVLVDFETLEEAPAIGSLTYAQIGAILTHKKLVMEWLGAVEDYVKSRLMAGESFPGFKLVEGRGTRKWVDEEVMEELLFDMVGDSAFESKLLSVAKAEKLLDKGVFKTLSEMITNEPGKPSLVPESDKRPAIETGENFNDLTN